MDDFLAMNGTPSFGLFRDNFIRQTTSNFAPDGYTFDPAQTDPDYAKGIYNLRPRPYTLEPAFPKYDNNAMPQTAKSKRPRNSLKKRLLVNARERERMRVLNKAFQSLRDALPCYIADGHMAKITTLRLAINYIKALTEVLNEDDGEGQKPPAHRASAIIPLRISSRQVQPPVPSVRGNPSPVPFPENCTIYAPPLAHPPPR